ncbi:MAG TPA: hypothetical protein VLC98_11585 [Phnomibacter sp.]|nr:hypothetical protein [Phnomibacter sp.]
MRAIIKAALLMSALFVVCLYGHSQADTLTAKLRRQAEDLNKAAHSEAQRMTDKMEAQTARLQQKMAKYERKLSKVFQQSDSLQRLAQQYMDKADPEYWLHRLQANDSLLSALGTGPYLQRLDSLKGMLKFLDQDINNIPALQSLAAMKARLGITQEYQQQLDEKMSYWKQLLTVEGLTDKYLPASFKKLQSEVLAYKSQVAQWKETLNDPAKMETGMLKLLNKLPAFQKFMQQNGELARLFGSPNTGAGGVGTASMAGLQTMQGMQQLLQQRFGGQAQQMVQQQLQAGMGQMNQIQSGLQNGLNNVLNTIPQGGAWGNTQLSPYQQEQADLKAQPLGKHFEFGWNLQTGSLMRAAPSSTDLGLSLGYKINPKSVIGIGVAYKFSLGSWDKIEFHHEGVGLRSFIDWRISPPKAKIFANMWISGGFEMNYWQRIANLSQLKSLAWQQSGLVGLTKKVKTGKKTMKMQLLWDFLNSSSSAENIPIQFRIGYNF